LSNKKLVAIGEALIDFIPSQSGCEFDEVDSFIPAVGGAPANVCAAFAKLGGRSVFLTQLGDDPFGHKIIKTLEDAGIDTGFIRVTDIANTALAFVSLSSDGNRTFSFYRKPSADMLYSPSQLDEEAFKDIFALHFCSVSLGDFPMKEAHLKAIELAGANGAIISFDPNLRFMLWPDREKLKKTVRDFIPFCHILKISDDELEFITGTDDIDKALPGLQKLGVKVVLYTCGSKGMKAYTRDICAECIAPDVQALDTTGAGDASAGSFLWKLDDMGISLNDLDFITEEQLNEAVRFAVKYCAISVQHKGAIPSYPNLEQIN